MRNIINLLADPTLHMIGIAVLLFYIAPTVPNLDIKERFARTVTETLVSYYIGR